MAERRPPKPETPEARYRRALHDIEWALSRVVSDREPRASYLSNARHIATTALNDWRDWEVLC